ncbi:MAG: DUF4389 domain-containing protein [Candidatus Dormibacteria bacterium]|jgi:hypothetical protein
MSTAAATTPRQQSRVPGVVMVVIGSVLALMTLGLLAGGGFLMWADQTQRDSSGYLTSGTGLVSAPAYAIATPSLDLNFDGRGWPTDQDALGKVRISASSTSPGGIFIGIAPRAGALAYLSGVGYDQLNGLRFSPYRLTYTAHGGGAPTAPASQTFWHAQASGTGTQTLTWKVASGQWIVVLMNADGSRSIAANVSVGTTAPFLFAIALGLLIAGGIALVGAVVLLALGIVRLNRSSGTYASANAAPWSTGVPPPPPVSGGQSPLSYPLRIEGRLDEPLSRWVWIVKWILLIPHYVMLFFLFLAMFVLTVIAFFAILVNGRYPRGIFDFNVGVLRWAWRVQFYGYGALGTDQYPPFSLDAGADYPASLDVPYPEHLSRGLVLVKWWLLAIPQYILVAVLTGGLGIGVHFWGLISILAIIAAFALLFTTRYPRGIFDFVMGLNRWVFRVLVYVLLMRDEYPPFRFDPGGTESPSAAATPPSAVPTFVPNPPPA